MITGDRLGVGHGGSRTAAYVGFWVKTLKDHLVSCDAHGISDYLMECGRMLEQHRQESEQDRQSVTLQLIHAERRRHYRRVSQPRFDAGLTLA